MSDCCEGRGLRPLIVRPAEAAALIGVSVPQLYRLASAGVFDVPRVAIGTQARGFRLADIERWVASRPGHVG
jgi:predicted DNA-binding transcriptional regulator AlpA